MAEPAQARGSANIGLPPSGLTHADDLVASLTEAVHAVLDLSDVRYDDINARSSSIFVVGWNKHQWTALPTEAAPHVGRARAELGRLREYAACASRKAVDRAAELREVEDAIERLIEQPSGSHPSGAPKANIEQVREYADAKLAEYPKIIRRLPTAFGDGEQVLVVDTSALLDRPDLQDWKLDDRRWTVVLLPQVHSELDDRKRDSQTREAAQKVIRQIDDLDRRGDTFEGVPLTGKLTAREVAISLT